MITRRIKPAKPEAPKSEVQGQIIQIARSMIAAIQSGYEKSSREDWDKVRLPAMNAVTQHVYTGGNRWLLRQLVEDSGWSDPRFVTFKQCSAMKDEDGNSGCIKKGHHGTKILRPILFEKKVDIPADADPDEDFLEEEGKRYKIVKLVGFKLISVFNISQTTVKPPPFPGLTPRDWLDSDFFEQFVRASGVTIKNDQPGRAFYSPKENVIHMPSKDAFGSADQYYATLLHEFFHATGHSDRMNRGLTPSSKRSKSGHLQPHMNLPWLNHQRPRMLCGSTRSCRASWPVGSKGFGWSIVITWTFLWPSS